jgi:hypothetical protein
MPPEPSRNLVRICLMLFPLGLVLTSIGSFGIWWWQREYGQQQSVAHASALRRDMSLIDIQRHTQLLQDAFSSPGLSGLNAAATYMESTGSAVNMGYEPRRQDFQIGLEQVVSVELDLLGTQTPREVRLWLVLMGESGREAQESLALAGLLSLAQARTGQRVAGTRRFACVPVGMKDASGRSPLQRVAAAVLQRHERVTHIHLLGGAGTDLRQQVEEAFQTAQTGTVIQPEAAGLTPEAVLQQMQTFLQE